MSAHLPLETIVSSAIEFRSFNILGKCVRMPHTFTSSQEHQWQNWLYMAAPPLCNFAMSFLVVNS